MYQRKQSHYILQVRWSDLPIELKCFSSLPHHSYISMADAKEAVVSVLRPSETAVFVVDTHPDSGTSSVSTTARAASYPSIRRVLAVVIHESHEQRHGAYVVAIDVTVTSVKQLPHRLFIYKWTRRDPPSLILVTALPISPLMSASVVRLTSSGSGLSKDGTPVSSTRSGQYTRYVRYIFSFALYRLLG